ncbi:MAG: hypothetical protein LBN93_09565 [Candidatus Symbiothrix sp.]|nr:hypothetical protein [Candidatus Symbiothrix sp.]
MNRIGQPTGSFFFLGPTGTGKTERNELRRPISHLLIKGELRAAQSLKLSLEEADELVWEIN